MTAGGHEGRVARAASSRFSSWSFPRLRSQPIHFPCSLVPDPPAMEQEEAVAIRRGSMASIQPRDRRGGRAEEILVSRRTLRVGVRPVREQSEAEIVVGARQRVDLEPLDLLLDLRSRRQEGGHDDHRAQTRGHSLTKLEARQRPRADPGRDETVHERQGHVRRGDESQQREQQERRFADPGSAPSRPAAERGSAR